MLCSDQVKLSEGMFKVKWLLLTTNQSAVQSNAVQHFLRKKSLYGVGPVDEIYLIVQLASLGTSTANR